ncbi:hypothetical protein DMH25_01365 [Streptomyces sp. WAC 01325]|nr:hypothetical protein DMH25_01365 [Streptomyces sp. WAC 01325]
MVRRYEWRPPARDEILAHERDDPIGERGRPLLGTLAYGGRLPLCLGDQRRCLVFGRTQRLFGGALPYPVGLRTCRGHDPLGLLFGIPPTRRGGCLGPLPYGPGVRLRLCEQGERRCEFRTEFGGTIRGDTARCGPAGRCRRPEPCQNVPETRHELSSW